MIKLFIQNFIFKSQVLLRWASIKRGFWLRVLLCLGIGLFALSNDETSRYDLRLNLRGQQSLSHKVVIVTISPSDVNFFFQNQTQEKEFGHRQQELTDSFYWDQLAWKKILQQILTQNPKSVAVTFFFGESLGDIALSPSDSEVFKNPKISWLARVYQDEYTINPIFFDPQLMNTGVGAVTPDEDGTVRRFRPTFSQTQHLAVKTTMNATREPVYLPQGSNLLINYRGGSESFAHYSISEILTEQIPANAFTDKIVIIGSKTGDDRAYLSPLGPMSLAEVTAHLVDNIVERRWIRNLPRGAYAFGIFFLVIFCLFLINKYPQSVTFVFLLWITTLVVAVSIWLFDSFQLWIPAISPSITILSTWIIMVGYHANRIQLKNWELEQQRKTLHELEQLKNNFISLISHDLKTPISKIQAVINRLLIKNPDSQDLKALNGYTEELHRYIQSVLKLIRVESRDFKLNKESIDINQIIEEAIELTAPLARDKNITIIQHLEPLFSIEADAMLLKEVLLNVIENAIKYTPNDGRVSISSTEKDDLVVVEISDTGEGISPDDINNVFGKFVRGKAQDHKTSGTGLGLYLVKYFVELHGGSVNLSSTLNQGTTLTLKLPTQIGDSL